MAGVFHNPSGVYLEQGPESLLLRLRTSLGAPIKQVFLRCAPDGEQQMLEVEPAPPRAGWHCQWWEISLKLHSPALSYRFFLITDKGCYWLTAVGLLRHLPTDHHDFQVVADPERCQWLEQSVFYQIFPDRFCDGDPSNNVRTGQYQLDGKDVVARPWGALPDATQGSREFFGGDLQGIEQKLDYLSQRLGVNGIYLNPIGTAPSNHKYDVASYTEVDPHLGGEEAFLGLKRAMEQRQMRLMLDIVPNHCGVQHPWFQAALADPEAETAEFFTFNPHPQDYECWLGVRTLPKLNYASELLRQRMYSGPDSIMRHWLRPPYRIDGWRIDVANMLGRSGQQQLGHKVIRGMRKAVKEENPDAYFLGENFFDASSYLQGDELDATMNYRGFMMPMFHWLTGQDFEAAFGRSWGDLHPLSSEDLETQWRTWRATVPWAATRIQFNLLDSHDTPRLLHLVNGDQDKADVARLLLFTYPGVPCLYYGDEIGLDGGKDPDNRRTMNWDESNWNLDELKRWSQLIGLRKDSTALGRGSFQMLCAQHDTLAFLREDGTRRCLVVARRALDEVTHISVEAAGVPDGTPFREFFSGEEQHVLLGHLEIRACLTQIWMAD
jgi:alpha-glucosidase